MAITVLCFPLAAAAQCGGGCTATPEVAAAATSMRTPPTPEGPTATPFCGDGVINQPEEVCDSGICGGEIGAYTCCRLEGACKAGEQCCSGSCNQAQGSCDPLSLKSAETGTEKPTEGTVAGAPTRTPVPLCTGDCSGDLRVTVDELVRGVAILLGLQEVGGCPALDHDGGGTVTVDELVTAVNNALSGCPGAPFCGDGVINQPDEVCDGEDLPTIPAPPPGDVACRADCGGICLPGACATGLLTIACCEPDDYCADRGAGMIALGRCFPSRCEQSPATCQSPTECREGRCCIPAGTSCASSFRPDTPLEVPCCPGSDCRLVQGGYRCEPS